MTLTSHLEDICGVGYATRNDARSNTAANIDQQHFVCKNQFFTYKLCAVIIKFHSSAKSFGKAIERFLLHKQNKTNSIILVTNERSGRMSTAAS